MKYMKITMTVVFLIYTMVTSQEVFGFLGFGNSVSWKEEVLLHDGSIIIVERTQTLGGYPTLDSRERVILTEKWVFPVPGTERKIAWEVDFHRPPEGSQLTLITVGFLNGAAYVATIPDGLIAYNYWKRPNPPYVFFKYDNEAWRQITLNEFPAEFKVGNVVVGRPHRSHRSGLLSISVIKEENHRLQPYIRQILRKPINEGDGLWRYPEMEYNGKGGWRSPGGAKAPLPITKPPNSSDGQK
ncbi:MAG: hypothetical protein V2B19_20315 [Pseudomonadota bacterium]